MQIRLRNPIELEEPWNRFQFFAISESEREREGDKREGMWEKEGEILREEDSVNKCRRVSAGRGA